LPGSVFWFGSNAEGFYPNEVCIMYYKCKREITVEMAIPRLTDVSEAVAGYVHTFNI
jgi:hypothetical protein